MQGYGLNGTLQAFNFGVSMKQLSSNITTWRLCALLSFGLFGSTVVWAENPVELRIEGVKNHALDENIRLHLNAVEKYDTTDIARYQDVVSAP